MTHVLSQPILVPLDGTDVAEGILPYVSEIARKANVPLVLLAVVDPGAIDYPTSLPPLYPSAVREAGILYRDQVEESSKEHALHSLNAIALRLQDQGLKVETRASVGNPAEEILRVAGEECGLIAMSTHGRNLIGRSILGSVTNKVLHSSSVPVLTITPDKAKKYQEEEDAALTTIVVPLDGSKLAERVLPCVEELARLLSLEILLTRVVRVEYPSYYTYAEFATRIPHFTADMAREALGYLERVSEGLKRKNLSVRHQVLRGDPAPALLDLAHETSRNLIVTTTHGRSGLSRWMMGSVAEALVRGAGAPVLVVRPQS